MNNSDTTSPPVDTVEAVALTAARALHEEVGDSAADAAAARAVTLKGILFAIGGALTLSINDVAIKFLSDSYALHQVILTRAFIGMALVLGVIWYSDTGFRQLLTRRPKDHLIRVSIVMVSNVTYFIGLAALPLADAVATAFIAPILVTLLSIVVLGEVVGPRRWAAVGVGMLGVLVMLRPGSGVIQPAALLVLISAFCYASSHMMTRRMRDTESAMTLNFFVQCRVHSWCPRLWGFGSATGIWRGQAIRRLRFCSALGFGPRWRIGRGS